MINPRGFTEWRIFSTGSIWNGRTSVTRYYSEYMRIVVEHKVPVENGPDVYEIRRGDPNTELKNKWMFLGETNTEKQTKDFLKEFYNMLFNMEINE